MKMCYILKTDGRRANGPKYGPREEVLTVYICIGYFLPLSVQSPSQVIRCISEFFFDFDNLASGKCLAVERNGRKFGPPG